jgi:hypothetical protein
VLVPAPGTVRNRACFEWHERAGLPICLEIRNDHSVHFMFAIATVHVSYASKCSLSSYPRVLCTRDVIAVAVSRLCVEIKTSSVGCVLRESQMAPHVSSSLTPSEIQFNKTLSSLRRPQQVVVGYHLKWLLTGSQILSDDCFRATHSREQNGQFRNNQAGRAPDCVQGSLPKHLLHSLVYTDSLISRSPRNRCQVHGSDFHPMSSNVKTFRLLHCSIRYARGER